MCCLQIALLNLAFKLLTKKLIGTSSIYMYQYLQATSFIESSKSFI